MNGKSCISDRCNINKKQINEKKILIYEDHRTILNVLFNEFTIDNRPVDIIMFDYHDDFCDLSQQAQQTINEFNNNPSDKKLFEIVEFELSSRDDNWIKAGMELNLIKNVFLFNAVDTSLDRVNEYTTNDGATHYLYNLSNIWDALSDNGMLNDIFNEEFTSTWRNFGWELNDDNRLNFNNANRNKFILDIDLDCFSTKIYNKTIAIPSEVLKSSLNKENSHRNHDYTNSLSFIKDIMNDSECITICFENEYCGGFREAFKIFNLVDELFFDQKLGS